MALYPYKCKCGRVEEVCQSISSYSEAPIVPYCCHAPMARHFTPIMVATDIQPYRSMIDGSVVNSKSAERYHMDKHGVVHTDEIMPDIVRNKKRMLESFQKDVKADVADAILRVEQGQKPVLIPESELIPSG